MTNQPEITLEEMISVLCEKMTPDYKASSINVERGWLAIADYNSIRTWTIRDNVKSKKQGLGDYYIEGFFWDGKKSFNVVIDACWFIDTCPNFDSIRDASDYIRKYCY